jgi:hypothetical protein
MADVDNVEIDRAVRKVLGDLLTEASGELGSSSGGATSEEDQALPTEVLDALQAVLRDLSPKQARALASLFEAISDQYEDEEVDGTEEAEAEGQDGIELGSEKEARARGQALARGKVSAIINLLKKSPALFRAAVKAAKAGRNAFNRWVNGLSNFNPAKWAIKGLPSYLVGELIDQLTKML